MNRAWSCINRMHWKSLFILKKLNPAYIIRHNKTNNNGKLGIIIIYIASYTKWAQQWILF